MNEQIYNTYTRVLRGICSKGQCETHLAACDQVLSESRAQQAGEHLLHPGSELQQQELPPSSSLLPLLNYTGLRSNAGLARVHNALWQTRQDLIQVIWKDNGAQKSSMRSSLLE